MVHVFLYLFLPSVPGTNHHFSFLLLFWFFDFICFVRVISNKKKPKPLENTQNHLKPHKTQATLPATQQTTQQATRNTN